MDLDFGHGFIARIASQNYKAVQLPWTGRAPRRAAGLAMGDHRRAVG